MVLTTDKQHVKSLLTETITLLCKNGLNFKSELSVEALIGVTIDREDVFLINIKEMIRSDTAALSASSTSLLPLLSRSGDCRVQGEDDSAVEIVDGNTELSSVCSGSNARLKRIKRKQSIPSSAQKASAGRAYEGQMPSDNVKKCKPSLEARWHEEPQITRSSSLTVGETNVTFDGNGSIVGDLNTGSCANNSLRVVAIKEESPSFELDILQQSTSSPVYDQCLVDLPTNNGGRTNHCYQNAIPSCSDWPVDSSDKQNFDQLSPHHEVFTCS